MSANFLDVEDLVGLPERVEEQLNAAPACCLAFNKWGTLLAAGCQRGRVVLYDYQTRGLAAMLAVQQGGHSAATDVTCLLWSASGRTLLSGASDGSLVVWDVESGTPRSQHQLQGTGALLHLAWAGAPPLPLPPQGLQQQEQRWREEEVLVSMAAGPACLLHLSTGNVQPLPTLPLESSSAAAAAGNSSSGSGSGSGGQVAIPSLDGAVVYAAGRGMVLVLRRADLALLDVIKVEGGARVTALELNHTGRRLLVTTSDQHIRVYLLHRPGERQALRAERRRAWAAGGAAAGVQQQQQQQDQQQGPVQPQDWPTCSLPEAAAAVAAAGQARPRSTAHHHHHLSHRTSLLHDDSSAWLTWQLDFALGDNLGKRPWKCAAFSPDGEYFASALEGGCGHVVYLWEAECEARVNAVLEGQGTRDGVVALCWHPNSTPMQLLAVGGSGSIYIWARNFIENWSAFAPDFVELHSNDEYIEPEDEFDINPRPQDQAAAAAGNAQDAAAAAEAEDVDIGTPSTREQELAAQLGAWGNGEQLLLHLPLNLNQQKPCTDGVPQLMAAVPQAPGAAEAAAAAAAAAEREGQLGEAAVAAAVAAAEASKRQRVQ